MRFITMGPYPAVFKAGTPEAVKLTVTALVLAGFLICIGTAAAGAYMCIQKIRQKDWGAAALMLIMALLAAIVAVMAAGAFSAMAEEAL